MPDPAFQNSPSCRSGDRLQRRLTISSKNRQHSVDVTNRESLIAGSKKWRERAKLEIESYLRARYMVREQATVH
jgi:hypothetical protein